MSDRRDLFERIASALERIAPPVTAPADWESAPAYIWDARQSHALDTLDALPLAMLRGIEKQKQAVASNLERLAAGAAAHDMLLWGARGMGKSALIRAAVADVQQRSPASLAMVQMNSGSFASLPALLGTLAKADRAFLLFVDDIGFEDSGTKDNLALRSLLDGSILPRPANIRLAVTSNRRAIVARGTDETSSLHERDERDNALALADRFGLTLGFHPCDRETYLEILRGYTSPLGLAIDEEEALAWAVSRGNRSGRTAYQFAVEMAGRAGKAL